MEKLVDGIHRFQNDIFKSHQELFARLAESQAPEVLFITCSDSRIVPSLMTQTDPGDLFIIRNAGNVVPAYVAGAEGGEAATIEYAVEALGVKDIIVCGHSRCGAMKALLDPAQTRELPAVARWLRHCEATRRIVRDHYGELEGEALLTATVEENVLVQLESLRTHPAVATRLARGRLKLHAWVYKLETGRVFAFDPAHGQFVPIEEVEGTRATSARLSARSI